MEQTLTLRATELNARHAHISVWQDGGLAGKLIVDREWWDALTDAEHYPDGSGVSVREGDVVVAVRAS